MKYTYEEVLGEFNSQVTKFKNDSNRVPARDSSKESTYEFAQKLHTERFSKALHPSVCDQYKP